MLRGLLRLGLDEELALETDALRVIHGEVEERREVVLLALQIGVEEGLVTLAAAPENVVLAPEGLGDIEGLLHLRRGVGEDMGVGVRGRTAHVARVGEQVGGAPEQLHAGGLLEVLGVGDDAVEVAVGLSEGLALGGDVTVVEAVERRADFLEKLKRGIEPGLRDRDRVGTLFPRADDGAGAEGVGAHAAERVPVRDGEAQVRGLRLPVDDLVGIVVVERERVGGFGAFVGDGLELGKVGAGFFHGGRRS